MNALTLLYQVNCRHIILWVEPGNRLKFKLMQKIDDKNHWFEQIKANKDALIELLLASGIDSEPKCLPLIYRSNSTQSVLSYAQQRLWFIEQLDQGSGAYNIPLCLELTHYNPEFIRQAIEGVVNRHQVMCSTFHQDGDDACQQVVTSPRLNIEHHSLTKDTLDKQLTKDIAHLFELDEALPLKLSSYQFDDQGATRYVLLINIHHIVFDGWSANIFISELDSFYRHYSEGTPQALADLPFQYQDYAQWQHHQLQGAGWQQQLNYWKSQLNGAETLALPLDKPRAERTCYQGANLTFELPEHKSVALVGLARDLGVSLYSLMLSSFVVLLHKLANQQDIVTGAVVANREIAKTSGLLGFFTNTQALRHQVDPLRSFGQFAKQVHSTVIDSLKYQDVPFDKVVDSLDIDRSLDKHPLFQVLFTLQNEGPGPDDAQDAAPSWFKPFELADQYQIAKYDLSLYVSENNQLISGYFNYATALFSNHSIEAMKRRYLGLLEQLTVTADQPLSQYDVLLTQERSHLNQIHCDTFKALPSERVTELFSRQSAISPDAVALRFKDKSMTYAELDTLTNRLTHWLLDIMAVTPDTVIALVMERSLEMIPTILAVHKAGAAYVPIDPDLPTARKEFILEDTSAAMILTGQYLKIALATQLTTFSVDNIHAINSLYLFDQLKEALPVRSGLHDLAYVIYTSGTTGQPKGVMLEHQALYNRIDWMQATYPINANDTILQKTPYYFDVSVWELIWAHCYGAAVVMGPPDVHKDPSLMVQLIDREKITVMHFVPSMFNHFLQYLKQQCLGIPTSLRLIFTSGEALGLTQVQLFNQLNHRFNDGQGCELHNLYGPTETAIDSTFFPCSDVTDSVPIGKPIQNTLLYILDEQLNQVPPGTSGELYIAGAGVSRGYLNRAQLSAERFIDNPFADASHLVPGAARMYKTGDVVRLGRNDNIEYIGRSDFQVKLRGLRIELGEIESQLCAHSEITQALVNVLDRNGEQSLVAYYVSDNAVSEAQLERMLQQQLPEYMVPKIFVHLEAFVLSSTGKLDRKALPHPDFVGPSFVAPQTPNQIALAQIWAEVLQHDKIGIMDDFFKMGGNSILAISVCHRMTQVLDKTVPLSLLFQARNIQALLGGMGKNSRKRIPVSKEKVRRLSFAQTRLWFVQQYEQGTNAYNIPLLLSLNEHHPQCIEQALRAILQRHEVLRSVIRLDGEQAYLESVPEKTLILEQQSLNRDVFEVKIHQDINHIFALDVEIPIRANLYRVEGASQVEFYLLINIHHIAFDGWSTGLFFNEFNAFYQHFTQRQPLVLPELPIQYHDFADWQRQHMTQSELARQQAYWSEQLSGFESLRLPESFQRPAKFQFQGDNMLVDLGEGLSRNLTELAKKQQVSLYNLMLSVFNVLLYKYSGQTDIVVGTPIANRHYPEIADLLGFFVNTLPIRTRLDGNMTFVELLKGVTQTINQAQQNQDIPFEHLVDDLAIDRDASRHPIYQVMFSIDEFSVDSTGDDWYQQESLDNHYQIAKQDLALYVTNDGHNMKLALNWATSLFDKQLMAQFIAHYIDLLTDIVAYPEQRISDFTLLTNEQRDSLIFDYNQTGVATVPSTLVEGFERQCVRVPDAVALKYDGLILSFSQLNERANSLAHFLKTDQQVGAGALVPVCMDRSVDLIVTMMAVMKCGAAYVPVGIDYPLDRIAFIIADTQATSVCTDSAHAEKFTNLSGENTTLNVNVISQLAVDEQSVDNISQGPSPDDLAYVIYTSGTTGQPKGVMIKHRSFADFVNNFESGIEYVNFLSLTTFTFDIFGLEYALPLLRGGTLVLTDIENAGAVLEKHGELTLIQQTPSVYRSLLLSLDSQVFPNITCLVGGEALDNELLSRLQQTFGRVINVYGPTETVIWSCSYDCTKATNALIIGRPLKNEKCYLLDDNMQPVPPGVVGELHIGGAGVAKGYLNRPELTAERFVENPFTTVQDKQLGYYRLYKTGDLVKMGFDGNIEYIGRSDFQVKINGHRIEVGEIEVQIADFSDITQVLVVVHNHNQQDHLIAYFVADSEVDHDRLTQYLYSKLPDYMMPSAFMQLAAFVLSTNGKLDRKALPRPKFVQQGYVAPQNTLETQLCQLWQEILDVPQVGVTDDFFKLGGNSILAINLVNRIRGQLDIELSLADLFEYNRIRPLIEHGLARQAIRIEPFECERYPLSYAQQRLWFIEQFDQGTAAYQIPILLKLGGTDKPANNEAAEEALRAVIDRHQVLRTCIGEDRSGFHQQIQPLSALNVATIHCEQEKFETVLAQTWQQGFDLTVDIPLRAHFIITENEQYLLINIHHIAFDGWSIELFMAELDAFYSYYDQQSPLKLAELPIQYKDFAVWQRRHLADGESERQLAYWATQLEDLGQMQLCSDFTRPVQIDFSGAHVCRTMDISTSIGLVELAKTQGVSLNTLMLSAFYLLLYKHSGQSDLVIGTPVANRHLHGIENLVGFFVNTLTLRVQVNKNSRFSEFLKRTGEVSHQAQNHQDVPFESVVEKLDQDHDASRHPLFQVMFALQNFGEEATDSDWYTHAQELLEQPFAKYDLSVVVANKGGQLVCTMNYATALFEQQTISTLLDHYFNLLGQIVCDIEQPLSAYQVLDKTQYIQLVNLPVASLAGNDQSMRLETRFEAHALATPDAIAIVTEHQQISYQDLNRQANQLAHFICSRCQFSTEQPELVAILLDSCADLIVAQLAILKTGAAFVPIDVRNPTERVKYILSDTQSPLVITHTRHQHLLQGIDSCEVVFLDLQPHQNQPDSHLMLHLFDTDLAYVIYTSGTTGRPKGVMIEHRQIGSTLEVQSKTYGITADAAFYLGISPAFDACVAVIYGALRNGGRLLITDGVDFSAPLVRQTTHLIVAASLLESLQPNWLPKLQCLVYGADKASQAVLNKFSYADIYVEYGVTEAAIASTHKQMRVGDTPTIGKPMANSQVYILDDDLQPVPFGCIGELYICGAGVARGYMNLKEQTKSSFIDNPFIKNVNDTKLAAIHRRLYKTGDLVRYCRNGEIEFHGRNDSQVKLRGLRIELGEISAALESLAGIDRAEVIVCRLNGVDTLVAYYVADAALADQWLDDQLKQLLPGYMQPATCIHLNELPLTLNGKLDVTRLPEPQLVNSDRVAPQNPLQQQLFDIWHSLLGHDDFGVEDDFFTIGGDSILVIQLSSRVKKDGYMLNVKEIFTHRTIAQQCLSITAANQHVEVVTEQGLLQGTFGLLPIQQWFFDQHKAGQIGNLHHWNQSFLLRIPAMGVDRLQAMLAELVAHHDMLRVTFKEYGEGNGGGTVQQYHDDFVMPPVQSLDVSQLTDNALELQLDKWQADFDIFNGPLFRFAYLHGYDDGVSRLYFACHHLLIDAVSWRILIEDLHGLVEAQPLVDKTSSYRQWTEFMTNYGDNYAHECVYWDGLLKCLPQYPSQKLNDNDTVATVVLDRPTSAGLINQANRAYKSSINDLLLTALAVALKGWNNELIQGVCLEGHGRENLCDEIDHSRTVGWFTSYLPVALYLFEDSNRLENVKIDLAKSIAFNKELLRQIPNNGIGFSTLAQGIDNGAKIPPISFNYLGQLVSEEALWQLASESSGENNAPNNRLPYLIAINGAMVDKQLKFSVTTRLGQQVSQQLADDFAQALVSITEHCLAKINDNQRQLSVSDLTNYKPYEICHPQAKDPWFIMPPADAGAETYFANLVQSMPDKRLVLFNNLYRQLCEESAEQARDIDFSVLAMQTITMIKSIQPSGPYQLLGWSFGGVLALEIARQLVANGDKVEKLLLVDAYFNYQKVFHASPVLQQLQGDAPIVDDINYRYQPGKGLFSNDCEVVLFKAQQKSVKYQDEAFDSVENSYLATHDNHLGDFVMPTSLTVVPLECGHYDCFEQPQIVAEICEQMQVLSLEVV